MAEDWKMKSIHAFATKHEQKSDINSYGLNDTLILSLKNGYHFEYVRSRKISQRIWFIIHDTFTIIMISTKSYLADDFIIFSVSLFLRFTRN